MQSTFSEENPLSMLNRIVYKWAKSLTDLLKSSWPSEVKVILILDA